MPDEDHQVVRRAWDAFSQADDEGVLRELHPEIVGVPFGAALEGTSYRGHAGVMEWWHGEIRVSWEHFQVFPERFERVGAKLLVTGRWHARGSESGVELHAPATWIIEVRDGKIVYWQAYTDHAQARRDIGLEDR